jgi:hypothetical protein
VPTFTSKEYIAKQRDVVVEANRTLAMGTVRTGFDQGELLGQSDYTDIEKTAHCRSHCENPQNDNHTGYIHSAPFNKKMNTLKSISKHLSYQM